MAAPSLEEFYRSQLMMRTNDPIPYGDWMIDAGMVNLSAPPPDILAQYLNQYGQEGETALKAAGFSLPASYVERTPENVAYYQQSRGISQNLMNWGNSDWEAYMGSPEQAGAGTWREENGQLVWSPSGPMKNSPHKSWFESAVGPELAHLIYQVVGAAVGNYFVPGIGGVVGNLFGQVIAGEGENLMNGNPMNLLSAAGSYYTPSISEIGSGIVEGGQNILNAITPTVETTSLATPIVEGGSEYAGLAGLGGPEEYFQAVNNPYVGSVGGVDFGGPTGPGETNLSAGSRLNIPESSGVIKPSWGGWRRGGLPAAAVVIDKANTVCSASAAADE